MLNPVESYYRLRGEKEPNWRDSQDDFIERINNLVVEEIEDVESVAEDYFGKDARYFVSSSAAAKSGLMGYVQAGLHLNAIKREWWGYKQKFKNFNDFCQKVIGCGSWYANNLIKAAKVCLALIREGFNKLPTCEAQARPLTKYIRDDRFFGLTYSDELIEKWTEVIETAPAGRITAAYVSFIVDGEPPGGKTQKVKLHASTYAQLSEKALQSGLSTEELLEKLVEDYHPQDPEPPVEEDSPSSDEKTDPDEVRVPITSEELQRWQEDLEQLLIDRYGLSDRSHQRQDSS